MCDCAWLCLIVLIVPDCVDCAWLCGIHWADFSWLLEIIFCTKIKQDGWFCKTFWMNGLPKVLILTSKTLITRQGNSFLATLTLPQDLQCKFFNSQSRCWYFLLDTQGGGMLRFWNIIVIVLVKRHTKSVLKISPYRLQYKTLSPTFIVLTDRKRTVYF